MAEEEGRGKRRNGGEGIEGQDPEIKVKRCKIDGKWEREKEGLVDRGILMWK